MKKKVHSSSERAKDSLMTELLILGDGRILVHNLTQPFAELLNEFNPDDGQISPRVERKAGQASRLPPTEKQRMILRDRRDARPTQP